MGNLWYGLEKNSQFNGTVLNTLSNSILIKEQALNIYRNPEIYADATEKLHVASFPEQIRVICDILNVRDGH